MQEAQMRKVVRTKTNSGRRAMERHRQTAPGQFSDSRLVSAYHSSRPGRSRLILNPSGASLERLEAIPLLFETGRARALPGKIVYDSWAHGPAVALRDVTDGHVRRVVLRAGKVSLEIVAERRQRDWQFVARVYSGGQVRHGFVLKVGARKLLPGSGGFYQWTSRAVPHSLSLFSYRKNLVFERVSWR
jgi:hypothetical protein